MYFSLWPAWPTVVGDRGHTTASHALGPSRCPGPARRGNCGRLWQVLQVLQVFWVSPVVNLRFHYRRFSPRPDHVGDHRTLEEAALLQHRLPCARLPSVAPEQSVTSPLAVTVTYLQTKNAPPSQVGHSSRDQPAGARAPPLGC
jgi:hypothetical protein